MIEVVVITPGGEASMTCRYGDPAALVATIDRLAACAPVIVSWHVRPARGYRWA